MSRTDEQNLVAVDSAIHRNTRVLVGYGREYGDDVHMIAVIPREIPLLLAHYPVFFVKHPETGEFGLSAMLGFETDENLFLHGGEWRARYVPLHAQRGPLSVGVLPPSGAGEEPTLAAHIDTKDARVGEDEGERLFDDDGEPTEYLQQMNSVLRDLVNGTRSMKTFVDELLANDLIDSLNLDIKFDDGKTLRIESLYTLNEEKLAALGGERLEALHRSGVLKLAHLMIGSVSNVGDLVAEKNARIMSAAGDTASSGDE